MIRAIVTDIEGTTSSPAVLYKLLAPYARKHLRGYVARHRGVPEIQAALRATRELADAREADETATVDILERWIDEDRKLAPLKTLQGLVWEVGYRDGSLRAHLYSDVVPCLRAWQEQGVRLYCYSSGSVRAQRLFFAHTEEGDISSLFSEYFDTTMGAKNDAASYRAIASAIGVPGSDILFLSDSQSELDAARQSEWNVVGVARENEKLKPGYVGSFAEVRLSQVGRGSESSRVASELAALGVHCYAHGWVPATSGNLSVRLAGDTIAITASGRDKGSLRETDIVHVNLHGDPLARGAPPSAETALHCALYRQFSWVGAVGHTHSLAATVLSRRYLEKGVLQLCGYELAKALPSVRTPDVAVLIPVVANAQDMSVLGERVSEALRRFPEAPAYLVAGHGMTVWARDIPSLRIQLEALEAILACELAEERVRFTQKEEMR